ncbi:hypothetical protein BDM02DRAFT_3117435 [Thelephora ganbajun]|uniref:Uncharacterized protein n=1 Tax=Thelephora ganbajun TaxID=370292 RepID=A0ACB6ZC88_THEGA|nr:hypothetical protein BDM02DRAFT_3117435 [Thelephora ganbajun]
MGIKKVGWVSYPKSWFPIQSLCDNRTQHTITHRPITFPLSHFEVLSHPNICDAMLSTSRNAHVDVSVQSGAIIKMVQHAERQALASGTPGLSFLPRTQYYLLNQLCHGFGTLVGVSQMIPSYVAPY